MKFISLQATSNIRLIVIKRINYAILYLFAKILDLLDFQHQPHSSRAAFGVYSAATGVAQPVGGQGAGGLKGRVFMFIMPNLMLFGSRMRTIIHIKFSFKQLKPCKYLVLEVSKQGFRFAAFCTLHPFASTARD